MKFEIWVEFGFSEKHSHRGQLFGAISEQEYIQIFSQNLRESTESIIEIYEAAIFTKRCVLEFSIDFYKSES